MKISFVPRVQKVLEEEADEALAEEGLPDTKALAETFYSDAASEAAAAKNCTEDEATNAVSVGLVVGRLA
jgi:hypothetical protein